MWPLINLVSPWLPWPCSLHQLPEIYAPKFVNPYTRNPIGLQKKPKIYPKFQNFEYFDFFNLLWLKRQLRPTFAKSFKNIKIYNMQGTRFHFATDLQHRKPFKRRDKHHIMSGSENRTPSSSQVAPRTKMSESTRTTRYIKFMWWWERKHSSTIHHALKLNKNPSKLLTKYAFMLQLERIW